ncbi:hypothetical protein EAE96_008462 [Botrytis aclada]|nr:hypothetical protein EAE96_008462 [Botrytis aclada]
MTEKQSFYAFYTQWKHLGTAYHRPLREMVAAMKLRVPNSLQRLLLGESIHRTLDDGDGWKQKLENWSHNIRKTEHLLSSKANMNAHAPPNHTFPTQSSSDPMDLGAFNTQSRNQQREEACRLGLCHHRKKIGHSANLQSHSRDSSRGTFGSRDAHRGAVGRGSQYPGNQVGSYDQNYFQESTFRNYNNDGTATLYRKRYLNAFREYVEDESLPPSGSVSKTPFRGASASPMDDYKSKATPSHWVTRGGLRRHIDG